MSKSPHSRFVVPFYRLAPGAIIVAEDNEVHTVKQLQCVGPYAFLVETDKGSIRLDGVVRVVKYERGDAVFGNKGENMFFNAKSVLTDARLDGTFARKGNRLVFSGFDSDRVFLAYVTAYLERHAKQLGYRPWEAINVVEVAMNVRTTLMVESNDEDENVVLSLSTKRFARYLRQNINRFKTSLSLVTPSFGVRSRGSSQQRSTEYEDLDF